MEAKKQISFDLSKLYFKREVAKLKGNRVVLVTPEMAERWLSEFNVQNRPLSEIHAKELARRMKNGQWQLNGETIKFATDGSMIDGQHRCRAIVIYGDCVNIELKFGLNPSVFETLDDGRRRTGGEVLSISSIPSYNQVAAAINFIIRHGQGRNSKENGESRPSNKDIRDWYFDHPEFKDMMTFAQKIYALSPKMLSPSKIAAYNYLFSQKSQKDAEVFLYALTSGSNLELDSPVLMLRNKLLQSKYDRQRKISPKVEKALIIKTWNYFREGKNVKILKFDTFNEAFPEIV